MIGKKKKGKVSHCLSKKIYEMKFSHRVFSIKSYRGQLSRIGAHA